MGVVASIIRHGMDQSYRIPKPVLTEKNLPDQSGKVFLITGANIGVGYEVARILYSVNGTVYMGCRTESKATRAIEQIRKAHPDSKGKIVYLHLDLSDLSTIKSTVAEFLSQETKLHWLDNNAGVMVPPAGSRSSQNHELQFATNILGPFLLTKLLQPILKATAEAENSTSSSTPVPVRVSWASSVGILGSPRGGGIQFSSPASSNSSSSSSPSTSSAPTPKDFDGGMSAYTSSKVANLWLAHEFNRRFGSSGPSSSSSVRHNAFNPGNLKTGLQQHLPSIQARFLDWTALYPPVFGAYTELFAGLAPELDLSRQQQQQKKTGGDGGKGQDEIKELIELLIVPWGRKSRWIREDIVNEMRREGGGSEKLWDWCERETRDYA